MHALIWKDIFFWGFAHENFAYLIFAMSISVGKFSEKMSTKTATYTPADKRERSGMKRRARVACCCHWKMSILTSRFEREKMFSKLNVHFMCAFTCWTRRWSIAYMMNLFWWVSLFRLLSVRFCPLCRKITHKTKHNSHTHTHTRTYYSKHFYFCVPICTSQTCLAKNCTNICLFICFGSSVVCLHWKCGLKKGTSSSHII